MIHRQYVDITHRQVFLFAVPRYITGSVSQLPDIQRSARHQQSNQTCAWSVSVNSVIWCLVAVTACLQVFGAANQACDRTFSSRSGSISSPGYWDPYPPNLDCTYFISQAAGFIIRLLFKESPFHLDAKDFGGCLDFIQVYDGSSESAPVLGGPYCASTRPPVLFSTQNVVMIRFHSDSKTSYGRQECDETFISSRGEISPRGYPDPFAPNQDCTYIIRQSQEYIIRLQFPPGLNPFRLDVEDGVCKDFVQIYDGVNTSAPVLGGPYCGDTRPTVVLFSTQNMVMIRFHSDSTTSYGHQGFNLQSGSIESPGSDGPYPTNLDCTYHIQIGSAYIVRLQFRESYYHLDVQGAACADYLQVYDGSSESAPVLGGPYCGDTRPPVLFSTQNVVMIRFHSDNKTSQRYQGFRLTCDKTLTSTDGDIRSPGYTGPYPTNLDCTYIIQQSEKYIVRLLFGRTFFHLDVKGAACADYIEVYDGDSESAPVLGGPYCGDTTPPVLFSTQNVVMIRVHSDNKTSYGYQGFTIRYTAIEKGKKSFEHTMVHCNKTIQDVKGEITSPGYSDTYPTNWDCTYVIQQDTRFIVRLEFASYYFHLDAEGGNCADYLQVYDGDSESAPVLGGPYCGSTRPPPLFSTQNVVMISFHTDNKSSYSCNKTVQALKGEITSPGYSNCYPGNWDCTYVIQQDTRFIVRLEFASYYFRLDVEGGDCVDYLQVYDGDSESAPVLGGPYCGSTRPPPLFSTQNVLMISFHTDNKSSYSSEGFKIYYTAIEKACNKTIQDEKGVITSPGYSDTYPTNWDCTYVIQQDARFIVRLEFASYYFRLDVEGGNCVDYLQVYDGDSESAPLLGGPYCGDTRPPPLFSTQNVVMIRFHSDNRTVYACNKTIQDEKGEITSPGYSDTYPANWDCTYVIQQDTRFIVRLEFASYYFRLDAEGGDCVDYVQVYDGDSESAPMLGGPYCGDTRPPPLFSTQNVVMIRFHSDNKTSYDSSAGSTTSSKRTTQFAGKTTTHASAPATTTHAHARTTTLPPAKSTTTHALGSTSTTFAPTAGVNHITSQFAFYNDDEMVYRSKMTWSKTTHMDVSQCLLQKTTHMDVSQCLLQKTTHMDVSQWHCSEGHFADARKDGTCSPCAVGFYQNETNQEECKKCPPRSTTQSTGSTRLSDCKAAPGVTTTVTVTLKFVLNTSCTSADEEAVSSSVRAEFVALKSDWPGLCTDSTCSNVHVTSTCEEALSNVITSVVNIEKVPPVLTFRQTNASRSTESALIIIVVHTDAFETSGGPTLLKNEVVVKVTWPCTSGYTQSGDTCDSTAEDGVSTELIAYIVGGVVGMVVIILLVVLVICLRPTAFGSASNPGFELQPTSTPASPPKDQASGENPYDDIATDDATADDYLTPAPNPVTSVPASSVPNPPAP
ncbi:hypothetical protein BaRGS_00020582 [Batillaria attramentaria]|uniref:CUB domain-containing protein n=1 Tax=Batillaria attramentaria TaxID=370345 RepID=A0ABD0KMN2_9CAEN